jgi:uncharacterized protein
MDRQKILRTVAHRPFPLPRGPWVMQQVWQDLLFLHYRVPPRLLQHQIPPPLELDTLEGDAWISIAPFRMKNVRFRGLPPVPTATNFLELNLRTYVTFHGRSGIHFLSLDADSLLAAWGARMASLPYFRARMSFSGEREFVFLSERQGRARTPAILDVRYRPRAPARAPGPLESWLVERYCLFQAGPGGSVVEIDIHHLPWVLHDAAAEVRTNSLTLAFGFQPPEQQPLAHFSASQEVLLWPLRIRFPGVTGLSRLRHP